MKTLVNKIHRIVHGYYVPETDPYLKGMLGRLGMPQVRFISPNARVKKVWACISFIYKWVMRGITFLARNVKTLVLLFMIGK